jgi:hypothetical protein
MPVVLRQGPYTIVIYTREGREPPHVHVRREAKEAKFWLRPLSVADPGRFRPLELRRIARILMAHAEKLLEEWYARHGRP